MIHSFLWVTVLLTVAGSFSLQALPGGSCYIKDEECKVDGDNVISILHNIPTLEQCRQICHDEEHCSFLSYFGANSFPFTETCMMFSTCDELSSCTDCRTEDSSCRLCSLAIEGHVADNLVEYLTSVESEFECQAACAQNQFCSFYTYYSLEDSSFPGMCLLLNDLLSPTRECNNCMTGLSQCEESTCKISNQGELTNRALITSASYVTNIIILPFGKCVFTVVAVGGGGGTQERYSSNGGGGSGFIFWDSRVVSSLMLTKFVVGDGGLPSVVMFDDNSTVFAKPGRNSELFGFGGFGYSGGGGGCTPNEGEGGGGGMDGTDGDNSLGGPGSKVHLPEIPIKSFQLRWSKILL